MELSEIGEWCQARVCDVMDGLLVAFGIFATALVGALAAGLVIFVLGISWELMNPDVPRTGDYPEIIDLIGLGVGALVWCGCAGHAFTQNGMNGFKRP